ncbi:uncharacterized protein LOC141685597 [Apium graveolens]|uniref:uncharacterized protein LOC141685597 n=1 Tax=Apium graveolens TaxID=4045 RepID=UPI003D7A504D
MYGGYANVGASLQDFRNFNKDAQMMIDKFKPILGYSIGRRNFELYGDSISLDATFDTNRYNLIFVLFTSVDKHDRCLGNLLCKETDFMEKIKTYIWSSIIETEEFESKWERVIKEFNLENNKWLQDMYALKASWIPAFFRNEPMFGLLRTTSRSESENSFLGSFINKEIRYMNFGCVLRVQWTSKGMRQLDWIEEILAFCLEMQIKRMSEEVDGVTHLKSGIHAFFGLKQIGVTKFPRSLVLNRWMQTADSETSSNLDVVTIDYFKMEQVSLKLTKIWFDFCQAVDKAGVEMDRLEHVHSTMKKLNTELDAYDGSIVSFTQKGHIDAMVDQQPEGEVHILPPNVCKNKGNYFKRLMSDR